LIKVPKFGKIKMNGVWNDFHESNVITGTISDDYCKFKIEEFKLKMKKYKIIESTGGLDYQKLIDSAPDYQKFMESGIEIESYSMHDAVCSIYDNLPNTWRQCYVLDFDTLKMFIVYWYRDSMGRITTTENFHSTLEKPLMKKYKIIPNQNKHPDSITYEFMMDHFTVESDSPVNAFRNYCEHDTFVLNLDSNFGYVLDTESLDLYYTLWSVNEQIGHSSFVMKLENPIEKPKMNKYKLSFKHKHIQDSSLVIEAKHPSEAVIKYCEQFQYIDVRMYAMNIETLIVFEVFWKKDVNGKVTTWTVQKNYKPEITIKPMNNLSFKTLTEANNKRLPLFKNSKGLPAHSKPDGSDWSHAEWLQAVIGELGEYANIMKKVQRGDMTMEEAKPSIEKELADVMTYFAILAQQLNIDLGQAVEDKFNEVSDRVDADVYIKDNKVLTNDELIIKSSEEFNKEQRLKDKEKLKAELSKLKVSQSDLRKLKLYSNAGSNNQDYATNAMIVGLAQMLTLFIKKPAQKNITLQDLNNGKVYTQPFKSGHDSVSLQEFSKLIVKDAIVMKTLQNGKDYEGFNVNVGDMIQFSDDRNVLYSLRVTKIE
jgi:NTP pyrophosphatase (non-canonical NTP hydrolase)